MFVWCYLLLLLLICYLNIAYYFKTQIIVVIIIDMVISNTSGALAQILAFSIFWWFTCLAWWSQSCGACVYGSYHLISISIFWMGYSGNGEAYELSNCYFILVILHQTLAFSCSLATIVVNTHGCVYRYTDLYFCSLSKWV